MKAVALMSHGIDSPVAAYLMKKKGFEIIFLHMKLLLEESSVQELKSQIDEKATLEVFDYYPQLEKIKNNCKERYTCILCKRGMLRTAENLAIEKGADAIVTGENLGQVASQTIENLKTIESAIEMPVIRPLLCLDKTEIISIARQIGTYNISTKENRKCPYVPNNPATKSVQEKVQQEEKKLSQE